MNYGMDMTQINDALSQTAACASEIAYDKANGLVFSEICTKNESILMDNAGRYRDYVELYNGGEDTNLEGFYLTDGNAKHTPFLTVATS